MTFQGTSSLVPAGAMTVVGELMMHEAMVWKMAGSGAILLGILPVAAAR